MSGHPTPDIDIGELRRLEKAANAPHDLKAVSMSVITNAEADYFTALRNAAPALLAAAEEGAELKRKLELADHLIELMGDEHRDDKEYADDCTICVLLSTYEGKSE